MSKPYYVIESSNGKKTYLIATSQSNYPQINTLLSKVATKNKVGLIFETELNTFLIHSQISRRIQSYPNFKMENLKSFLDDGGTTFIAIRGVHLKEVINNHNLEGYTIRELSPSDIPEQPDLYDELIRLSNINRWPSFPKQSPHLRNLTALPADNDTFAETFISLRTVGIFYGTDEGGNREDYSSTIKNALHSRIWEPIVSWSKDPWTCFFKPYTPAASISSGVIYGLFMPILTILSGLGFLGAVAANPAMLISMLCVAATFELMVGIVALGLAAWHQAKAAIYHRSDKERSDFEQNEARAYFLDGLTRLALVIPLAVVQLVATPLEFVRFITRSFATLYDCFSCFSQSGKDEAEANNPSPSGGSALKQI